MPNLQCMLSKIVIAFSKTRKKFVKHKWIQNTDVMNILFSLQNISTSLIAADIRTNLTSFGHIYSLYTNLLCSTYIFESSDLQDSNISIKLNLEHFSFYFLHTHTHARARARAHTRTHHTHTLHTHHTHTHKAYIYIIASTYKRFTYIILVLIFLTARSINYLKAKR